MPQFNYGEAFCRNEGLVSKEEQQILRNCTVAIPGLGGAGGAHLLTLGRIGIGGFHLADADTFSLMNFNRQYGAVVSTLEKPKTEVMTRMIRDINPEVRLKVWEEFIDSKNVEAFLEGCDLVMDSIDVYAVEERRCVFKTAQRMGIPVISAGPLGFSASMIIITAGSMAVDDYFGWTESMPYLGKMACFVVGVAPSPYYLSYMDMQKSSMKERRGPCISSSISLCAGFAAIEAIKIFLRRKKIYPIPYYYYMDPYLMKFKRGRVLFGSRNPIQRLKIMYLKRVLEKT